MNNNSIQYKIVDGLTTTFYIIFSIVLAILASVQASLFGIYFVIGAFLIFTTLLIIIIFADILARRYKLDLKTPQQLFAISIFAVFLAYVSCCMTCTLPSDTQILYDSAAALINNGTLNVPYDYSIYYPDLGFYTLSDYFCRYPNNIAMLLILTGIYSIGSLFGFNAGTISGQSFAVLITAISVAVAVHFLCKSAQYIFKSVNVYFHCLLLNILFLSYYYSSPNFYTDIWILCPLCCGLYFAVRYYTTKKNRYAFLCSLLWAIGSQLKITVLIPLIAFCIFIVFEKENTIRNKIISLLYITVPLLIFIYLFHTWYYNNSLFDFSRHEELYYPFTVWISYGSHGIGGYHYGDSVLAYQAPYHLRDQVVFNHIKDIFSAYSPAEYLQFMYNKLSFIWGDGLFEGGVYAQWALFENWTNYFTNPTCHGENLVEIWTNSFAFMLVACGLIASLIQIKKRDNPWLLFINVLIFGFILYLCIFEAAPRRAIPAMLFFMLDTLYLLKLLSAGIQNKYKSKI